MSAVLITEHPHVYRDQRQRAVVGKAALEVHVLAAYYNLGWSVTDLAEAYPFLTRGEILDALSYYEDHREEIDTRITANLPPAGHE